MVAKRNSGLQADDGGSGAATPHTFQRRGGRLGPQLRSVMADLLPVYEMPVGDWDFAEIFGRPDPSVVFEIGSGMGEASVAMAAARPDECLICIDVHDRGIAATVRAANERGLDNLRVLHGDAIGALRAQVPVGSLAGLRAWFPDPWPKTKHHKRRLVTDANVALMVSRLRPGGTLHVATDVPAYADVCAEVLAAAPGLAPVLVRGSRPQWRPLTKFEAAGERAGRPGVDFIYRRI